jgi:hypothetical protein
MQFDDLLRLVAYFHGAYDILIVAILVWMLWITRQIISLRETQGKILGELEIMRNNRKVKLVG